ncbi:MAG: TrkA-N domain protein [Geobacteraceae bacterium]|jgi:trk system potassium uptake protein TrkA|nr:TrkA-N domain protein [Geobacteraceae bacterium]
MFVIIVGGGKVGAYLASMLLRSGHRVKVIETQREEIPSLQKKLPLDAVMQGNGTDPFVLETAGIRQAHVVAAVTGADETNLVIASLARFEFGVKRTIARINDPMNEWIFVPKMGVDVALNQADLMAHLIAEEMSLGEMTTLLKLRKGEFSLVEEKVHPASHASGKTIAKLGLPAQSVIAAVIRKGKLLIPRGDLILQENDEVLALVHSAQVSQLAGILGPVSKVD